MSQSRDAVASLKTIIFLRLGPLTLSVEPFTGKLATAQPPPSVRPRRPRRRHRKKVFYSARPSACTVISGARSDIGPDMERISLLSLFPVAVTGPQPSGPTRARRAMIGTSQTFGDDETASGGEDVADKRGDVRVHLSFLSFRYSSTAFTAQVRSAANAPSANDAVLR